jgi:MFS superfamily sulfate permease-like transporter
MLLAVAMSLLVALRHFSTPAVAVLGHLPGTHDYLDTARHNEVVLPKNLLIVRPEQPLFFANVEQVTQWIGQRALSLKVPKVVLSLEESSTLDVTSVNVLAEFKQFLDQHQIALLLARVKDASREALFEQTRAAHLGEPPPCFWSVADAVAAAHGKAPNGTAQALK